MAFAKASAAWPTISNLVSSAKMRMGPISLRVMLPTRQTRGRIHFGSALRSRPTLRRNQTPSPSEAKPFSSRVRGRARSRGSRAWVSRMRTSSPTSSGSGRSARRRPIRAPASCSAVTRSASCFASCWSSLDTGAVRAGCSSRRWRSWARMSSALGGALQIASMLADWNTCSVRRRLACVTSRTETPFLPARPVRPER